MKIFLSAITFLLLCLSPAGTSETLSPWSSQDSVDHSPWSALLQKHVSENGFVNYGDFGKDRARLEEYLQHLAAHPPGEDVPRDEKLAYYINLYNAGTVALVLDNYPLASIKELADPWGEKVVLIGDKKYSLGHIEHKILRKMEEPRIHFAINCASISCPKLLNRAFVADRMEEQLEQVTRDFINDPKMNELGDKKWRLSQIFQWYGGDFKSEGSLRDYIRRYADLEIADKPKINYLPYNWALNGK